MSKKQPRARKPLTEEQKQALRDRLSRARDVARQRREDAGRMSEQHVEIASIDDVSAGDAATLKQRIADLEAKLAASEAKRGEAEKQALASAQAQSMLAQREIQEVPTGKTVMLPKCTGYKVVGHKDDGRDILKPTFAKEAVPTFFYKIDMPPVGGTDLKLNGTAFYHGAVYEMDLHTLRTIKEIVYRLWRHDADIHGSDENFYRKPGAYESTQGRTRV